MDLFSTLPDERVIDILYELPYYDLLKLCSTSRRFNYICNDETFWRRRLLNDFGISEGGRELYGMLYEGKQYIAGMKYPTDYNMELGFKRALIKGDYPQADSFIIGGLDFERVGNVILEVGAAEYFNKLMSNRLSEYLMALGYLELTSNNLDMPEDVKSKTIDKVRDFRHQLISTSRSVSMITNLMEISTLAKEYESMKDLNGILERSMTTIVSIDKNIRQSLKQLFDSIGKYIPDDD